MGPIRATIRCTVRPFGWSGRASRSEFWWYTLALGIGGAVGGFYLATNFGAEFSARVQEADPFALHYNADQVAEEVFGQMLMENWERARWVLLALLLPYLSSIAVTIRRLHDTGRSGWWYLISMVPLIGGLWLLILMIIPSEPRGNEWGPPEAMSERAKAKLQRSMEPYMQPRSEIDVHDTPDAIRALRHARMPDPIS